MGRLDGQGEEDLKAELKRKGISDKQLAELLNSIGTTEIEGNFINKIS